MHIQVISFCHTHLFVQGAVSLMFKEPSFTIGVEEEYWLVHQDSGDLIEKQPADLMDAMTKVMGEQVTKEFHGSQIEIGTRVCHSSQDVRQELVRLRSQISAIAAQYELAIIAASTHPTAEWDKQMHSEGEHYQSLVQDFRQVILRLLICGMHVHIGVEDKDLRIELINQMNYFLPHLLALSTSSPFWRGKNMGLKSYRLSLFDNLPRSGPPEVFSSYAEYERIIEVLLSSGAIDNPAKIWWDIRPSTKWPTMEMRITDICTSIDDAVCIASLTRCIARSLYRLRCQNQSWRKYPQILLKQNRWMAQRAGISDGLIDFGQGVIKPFASLADELIEFVRDDMEYFDCCNDIEHIHTILQRGTSADRQNDVYNQAMQENKSHEEALAEVKQFLQRESVKI